MVSLTLSVLVVSKNKKMAVAQSNSSSGASNKTVLGPSVGAPVNTAKVAAAHGHVIAHKNQRTTYSPMFVS